MEEAAAASTAAIVAAKLPFATIISVYGLASTIVVALIWSLSGKHKYLSKLDRLLMSWFAFSGLTHIVLEGYFVFTPALFHMKNVNFLAEVWKEYSNGDTRYSSRDSTVLMVEGITAVLVGPGCLLAVYAIATRKPYQYTIQLAVSLSQLYGDIVYFGHPIVEGVEVSKPGALYFWFYYIFMNNIWVVIPLLILVRSWNKISKAMSTDSPRKKEIKSKAALDKRRN